MEVYTELFCWSEVQLEVEEYVVSDGDIPASPSCNPNVFVALQVAQSGEVTSRSTIRISAGLVGRSPSRS